MKDNIQITGSEDLKARIFLGGDFAPVGRPETMSNENNYQLFSEDLLLKIAACDESIVNLECPLTQSNEVIKKSGPAIKSSSATINFLKNAGFSTVVLANNHILDYGEIGLEDTIRTCEEAGIKSTGAGKNSSDAANIFYKDVKGIRISIVNAAEHEFSIAGIDSAGANNANPENIFYQITEAKKNSDYCIMIFHGGHEHFDLPSVRIKNLFHFFADVGADSVIGHHPHRVSGYEIYKNKPLFYSLGNFLFDEKGEPDFWYEGLSLILEISKGSTSSVELIPFTQCKREPLIKLMIGDEKDNFIANVSRLSKVIAVDSDLKKEWKKFADISSSNNIKNILNLNKAGRLLFKNKYFRKKFINDSKLLSTLNLIRCESLRDVLINSISKEINKN